jgi:fatty-acyl-CoA synthase
VTGKQILNHCKGNIAHYKIPKYIKFVTEYPLTVSGKVQKYIMRQQFEEEIKTGKH